MKTSLATTLALATLLAAPAARAIEPFHLQPILPTTGVLVEARPTVFNFDVPGDDDVHFGFGWLLEGRLAIGQIHGAVAFPLGMAFVEGQDTAAIGNFEIGGGYGDRLGQGSGVWGCGARILVPSGGEGAPAVVGYAGRPYNIERHVRESATIRAHVDIGTDNPGGFVGQLEVGPDFWIPGERQDNELLFRFGGLAGYHVTPGTTILLELAWIDALTASSGANRGDGQVSLEPGVRFFASSMIDIGAYLTVPVDDPLGGDAFAFGLQVLLRL